MASAVARAMFAGLAALAAVTVPPVDAAVAVQRRTAMASATDSPLPVSAPAARRRAASIAAAIAQIGVTVVYDPAYVSIDYPGGDVAPERGVCSDVVIRAMRAAGYDLQREVHEDMRAHFGVYPQAWGLRGPDRNIDHRRVPNIETRLRRAGMVLPDNTPVQPGDIVSWRLPGGLAHIGIVSDRRPAGGGRYFVVHNIGAGAQLEDVLEAWPRAGHFRPFPDEPTAGAGQASRPR